MKLEYGVHPRWKWIQSIFGHKFALNSYAPYLGAGISVQNISNDFQTITVQLEETLWNPNYVGTHFGGSLYSMCDPFYMFILIAKLGDSYIVWDKSACIDFLKPGTGTVTATFHITDEQLEEIRMEVAKNRKTEKEFRTFVMNEKGEKIAEVRKVLYIRRKKI